MVERRCQLAEFVRQLAAEGVSPIAVVTDEPEKYARGYRFDSRVTIYHRRDLDTYV